MLISLYALIAGFFLDLVFGDPLWLPHPIRFIGLIISKGENLLRKTSCKSDKSKFICGMILTIFVVAISFAVPFFILYLLFKLNIYLGFAVETIMCYQVMATKSLKKESMKVYYELKKGDLKSARKYLSWIVSRDTENLDFSKVAKAAVETVAENTSDGVIAPLIFMLIGGAPLGFLYKAINTLDSMIGYKNDKYIYFGKFAAKLDDVASFIPARISAYFMILASFLLGFNFKGAFKIYLRDRRKHKSPNSAHTESVCAGALNIELLGNSCYFGKLVIKPTIGDNTREIEAEDIIRANKLLYATSILGLLLGSVIKLLLILILIKLEVK
jgi:adenosylcobinamide-phosphate synthase